MLSDIIAKFFTPKKRKITDDSSVDEPKHKLAKLSNNDFLSLCVRQANDSVGIIRKKEEDFLRELKCPICLDFFSIPIMTCLNGHSICGRCLKEGSCFLCRHHSGYVCRNLSLESMCSLVQVDCTDGCGQKLLLVDQSAHSKKQCMYRPIKCALGNCRSIVLWDNYQSHLAQGHMLQQQIYENSLNYEFRNFSFHSILDDGNSIFRIVFEGKEFLFQQMLLEYGGVTWSLVYNGNAEDLNNNIHLKTEYNAKLRFKALLTDYELVRDIQAYSIRDKYDEINNPLTSIYMDAAEFAPCVLYAHYQTKETRRFSWKINVSMWKEEFWDASE